MKCATCKHDYEKKQNEYHCSHCGKGFVPSSTSYVHLNGSHFCCHDCFIAYKQSRGEPIPSACLCACCKSATPFPGHNWVHERNLYFCCEACKHTWEFDQQGWVKKIVAEGIPQFTAVQKKTRCCANCQYESRASANFWILQEGKYYCSRGCTPRWKRHNVNPPVEYTAGDRVDHWQWLLLKSQKEYCTGCHKAYHPDMGAWMAKKEGAFCGHDCYAEYNHQQKLIEAKAKGSIQYVNSQNQRWVTNVKYEDIQRWCSSPDFVVGEPRATEMFTVEQLKKRGYVGIWQNPKEVITGNDLKLIIFD